MKSSSSFNSYKGEYQASCDLYGIISQHSYFLISSTLLNYYFNTHNLNIKLKPVKTTIF